MARGRIISRTLGSSRKFAELGEQAGKLGEFAQALFPLIVVVADDFGRLQGDPESIKWVAWPSSPRSIQDFNHALTAMEQVGLIQRYAVNGTTYAAVACFDEHQLGLHKRTKSRFPDPPGDSGKFRENPGLARARGTELNRTEGKGTEQKAADAAGDDGFDAFWTAYPNHKAKQDALKAWRSLKPSVGLQALILEAVARQCQWADWRKDGGRYVPMPATWLRGHRWDDEPEVAVGRDPPRSDWRARCQHQPACETGRMHAERDGIDRVKREAAG